MYYAAGCKKVEPCNLSMDTLLITQLYGEWTLSINLIIIRDRHSSKYIIRAKCYKYKNIIKAFDQGFWVFQEFDVEKFLFDLW